MNIRLIISLTALWCSTVRSSEGSTEPNMATEEEELCVTKPLLEKWAFFLNCPACVRSENAQLWTPSVDRRLRPHRCNSPTWGWFSAAHSLMWACITNTFQNKTKKKDKIPFVGVIMDVCSKTGVYGWLIMQMSARDNLWSIEASRSSSSQGRSLWTVATITLNNWISKHTPQLCGAC